MERALIQKVVDEARAEEANLVIWDRRDTFTVEQDDVGDLEVGDLFRTRDERRDRRR